MTTNAKKIEEIEVNEERLNVQNETIKKKKQKISPSYTLRAMKGNIDKMEEAKMLTLEEVKQMREIHKKAVERWIGGTMEI